MTRKELDHDRYIRNREERLRRQREYYLNHKEWCLGYRNRRISKEKSLIKNENIREDSLSI